MGANAMKTRWYWRDAWPLNALERAIIGGVFAVMTIGTLIGLVAAAFADPGTISTMQFPTTGWGAYAPGSVQCGELLGANMNITTDQAIPIVVPTGAYLISDVVATNASVSLTTAAGGVYTAISKGGTAVVASGQAYSTLTAAAANAAGSSLLLTLNTPTAYYTASPLYLSLTTGQGAAATVDIRVFCKPLYR